ncbi:MAG: chemotaxis protein CheV [Ruminococcaceae bacterium]|nr:chemotaxis protein CheV [Oscillospiraceae bacterium]
MNTHAEILLESGTNELGILEFTIDGNLYGINVAKVKEIMKYCPVNPMQKSNANIEGVFKPRDEVITVVDLAHYLGLKPSDHLDTDVFIITNFSQESYAFHVHEVVGISRISWTNLQKPDEIIYGGTEGIATAIAEYDGRLITILDFEKIITEINPESGIHLSDIEKLGARTPNRHPILIVEDSMLLSRMVVEGLSRAGYTKITKVKNGQEAWDYLQDLRDSGKPILDQISCMVTDIEMPVMDGHHLIKLIKADEVLSQLPIIIFSSLINEQLLAVGKQLGADGQFSKPELYELIQFVDKITGAEQ